MEISSLVVLGLFVVIVVIFVFGLVHINSELTYTQKKIDNDYEALFGTIMAFADVVGEMKARQNDIKKDTSYTLAQMEDLFERCREIRNEITIHCNKSKLA